MTSFLKCKDIVRNVDILKVTVLHIDVLPLRKETSTETNIGIRKNSINKCINYKINLIKSTISTSNSLFKQCELLYPHLKSWPLSSDDTSSICT